MAGEVRLTNPLSVVSVNGMSVKRLIVYGDRLCAAYNASLSLCARRKEKLRDQREVAK